MASKNKPNFSVSLDTAVKDAYGAIKDRFLNMSGANLFKYINKGVGIEVELEGTVGHLENPSPYWTSKPDTSLRDGMEYVLRFPVEMKDLGSALDDLTKVLSPFKPASSIRTSTHIHVNVTTLTLSQVYNAVFAYYLVEELLLRLVPIERKGNLFCLRMNDSNSIYHLLKWSFGGRYFSIFNEEEAKYSALNLCTVKKYGSLEFRFMAAMWKKSNLLRWSTVLHELIFTNCDRTVTELLQMYEDLPVASLIRKMFPTTYGFVIDGLSSDDLNELLHTNYDALSELGRVQQGKSYYTLPPEMWNDDADVEKINDPMEAYFASINVDHDVAWANPPGNVIIQDDVIPHVSLAQNQPTEDWDPEF